MSDELARGGRPGSRRGARGALFAGFTLVELLVSTAILCVIVFLVASMVGLVSVAWQKGVGQNERRSNGRALLGALSRELQAAVIPAKNPAVPSPANLQFIANISSGAGPANPTFIPSVALNPHALFWQAPIATDTTHGNLAEVGYFVRWDTTTTPGTARGGMYRFFVNPSASSGNYLVYSLSGSNPVNWLSVVDTVAPATPPDYQGWFADDVIAFWVRCLDSAGKPITKTAAGITVNYGFDSRQGYTDSNGVIHPPPALPAAVDLAIVTIDSRTAKRISTPILATSATPETFWADIDAFMAALPAAVKPGAQLFSTTVYLSQ